MAADKVQSPGRMILDRREKLTLTGAREVVRFDEFCVELNTDLGELTVDGQDLKLKCLSLEDGLVVVEGTIDSVCYGHTRQKRGLFR